MGVRLAATKLHIPPSVARRPTFLPFVAVLLLCSASYLLGVWQHSGFASPSESPAVSITTATAATRKKAPSARARDSWGRQLGCRSSRPARSPRFTGSGSGSVHRVEAGATMALCAGGVHGGRRHERASSLLALCAGSAGQVAPE